MNQLNYYKKKSQGDEKITSLSSEETNKRKWDVKEKNIKLILTSKIKNLDNNQPFH